MVESKRVIEEVQTPPGPVEDWPPQVDLVISALEAGGYRGGDRRVGRRRPFRARASLRLFSDAPQAAPWTLFARDVHSRGLGFVTQHRLPLGYGGMLDLPMGNGELMTITCTLLRCREAAPGWFEGSLYFNREQPELG